MTTGRPDMPGDDEDSAIQEPWLGRGKEGSQKYSCRELSTMLDDYLAHQCGAKHNRLQPCTGESDPCPCSSGPAGSTPKVDLIVLIDRSGSMQDDAATVSNAAAQAIEAALHQCPSDLRVTWLTVDSNKPGTTPAGTGGWPGTNFTATHEQYLVGIGASGPFFHNQPDATTGAVYSEQGADAITDLSKFFDWRKDACKAIFYISDTTLDSGYTQEPSDVAATQNAITQAIGADVTVFAHLVSPSVTNNLPATVQDYQNLCDQTGGSLYVGVADQAHYRELLTQAICGACGPKCETADIPKLTPCISVAWGDSECDCMETDDTEVFCITVCNCYSNVTFANFVVGYVYVTDGAGNKVPTLPDGSLSVEAFPRGPICFGDLGPCTEDGPNCRARQFVVLARGAKAGPYQIHLGNICFDVVSHRQEEECFTLELCADR